MLASTQCAVAVQHRGACVNLISLTRAGDLAVSDWYASPRSLTLSQAGHDVVGRELLRLESR